VRAVRAQLIELARSALLVAPALLALRGDDLARELAACSVRGAEVQIYRGSTLFKSSESQLTLSRGRALACSSDPAVVVLAALEEALESFPSERLRGPLRVHLDPRMPRGEAPVASIEVHATSRELLLRSEAALQLPRTAWTHELLHALAPPPPVLVLGARRLWLTLEEGFVACLTAAFEPGHENAVIPADHDQLAGSWEQLALPEYDPHALAAGFTRELMREYPGPRAPEMLGELLDCLAAETGPPPSERLRHVAHSFVARCAPGPQRLLEAAARSWLPQPLSPWAPPGDRMADARPPETR
jgi:hypothetical protein